MKNIESWGATKFQLRGGTLRATRDTRYVRVGSRLVVDLIASRYPSLLTEYAQGRLVDLGCGNVPLFATYKSIVTEVVCIDWQESPHAINHVDHVCDLNGQIPLPDASVDTVLISDVFEHIAKPWVLWAEICRILKPGGHVIGNVPFLYWVHEAPHDYHRYTEFALRRYGEDNGLQVCEVSAVGGLIEVIVDITGKAFAALPFVGRAIAAGAAALGFAWYRTRLGKRVAEKSARLFPSGYFFVMCKPGTSPDIELGKAK